MRAVRNASYATCRAIAYAGRSTWAHARSYWKLEILLMVGLGLSYLLFAKESSGGTPKLVTAFLIPAGGLCLTAVVAFILILFWSPIRNHRELCKERDDLKRGLEKAKAEDEAFRRWLHLRHWAHNWDLALGQEALQAQNAVRRPDETFDLSSKFLYHRESVARLRSELDFLGQPTLKDKFANPDEMEEPQTRQAFLHLIQEAHQQARLIASGYPPPPSFEGPAPEGALTMPNLYSIP